jgi:hypothetical protein
MTQKDFEVDLQTIERYPTLNFFVVQTLSRLEIRPQEGQTEQYFIFCAADRLHIQHRVVARCGLDFTWRKQRIDPSHSVV